MMARKKPDPFPDVSCGACHYCLVMDDDMEREQLGVCFANPPMMAFDGHGLENTRPVVSWDEHECVFFKHRVNA